MYSVRKSSEYKEQFDTRFGTLGRSMMLVNNPATRTEIPIASKHSIEMSLRRMGQQMNRESDVLFLYMTSHGLPNQFEMENAPLDLTQVDPKWLRETLDASGYSLACDCDFIVLLWKLCTSIAK